MTTYIEQTSASDRIEAARTLLAAWDEAATPGPIAGLHDAGGFALKESERIRAILRALITPPAVGEPLIEAAARIAETHGYESGGVDQAVLAGIEYGIQMSHETWEPEVAQRPSQEQMLRWLGIEHKEDAAGTGYPSIFIPAQHIKREEI